MGANWKLVFYKPPGKAEAPVRKFLKDKCLRKDEKAKLTERLKLLAKEGSQLAVDMPAVLHPLKGERYRKIYELRVSGTPSNPRIFLFISDKKEIVLLFGVRKKGAKAKEMERYYRRAADLRDEWLQRT
ncbi:MAG: type II toxin-antitoxin system RelE/ParE family toxin [Thermoanaerobaculales bacterium]|nr:type II toxin-antitoxin system RelE/ParE family toxin [Thermoanaerobaculales bacterium]